MHLIYVEIIVPPGDPETKYDKTAPENYAVVEIDGDYFKISTRAAPAADQTSVRITYACCSAECAKRFRHLQHDDDPRGHFCVDIAGSFIVQSDLDDEKERKAVKFRDSTVSAEIYQLEKREPEPEPSSADDDW